jgi:hypothetical protein
VRPAAKQEMTAAHTVRRPRVLDQARDHVRTFSFVRAAWNRVLSARHCLWHAGRKGTSYAGSGQALTAMEADPGAPYLTWASSWRGKNDGTADARPADPAYIRSDPRYARECQLSPSPGNRPGQDPARRRQGGTGG